MIHTTYSMHKHITQVIYNTIHTMYKYKFFLNKNFMISFITQEIIEENTLV